MSQPGSARGFVEVSIVVPLYNEQENFPELFRRLRQTLDAAGIEFELILVNDGSRDDTSRLLTEAHAADDRVTVISLSRNFGHQAAICAGIDHACGRAVILMDGDLQDPPEVLPRFITAWQDGNDVVYAVRTKRKEGIFRRFSYAAFYRLFRAVSEIDMPLDSGDFCLMDRKVVDALRALPERNRFVRGLRAFVGFKQVGLAYERDARLAGEPKYTLSSLCRLALDGIVSFSSAPLSLLSLVGWLFVALALLGGAGSVFAPAVAGWWIVVLVVGGCTGLQLVGMGIIGAYVRRIFLETKGRPTYIVGSLLQPGASAHWKKAEAS